MFIYVCYDFIWGQLHINVTGALIAPGETLILLIERKSVTSNKL